MRRSPIGKLGCVIGLAVLFGCNGRSSADETPMPLAPVALAPKIVSESSAKPSSAKQAVIVSIDGLGAVYLKPMLDKGQLPGLAKLSRLGAYTHDARTDKDNTTTIPNHTSMLTGLPVAPPWPGSNAFHGYTYNRDPNPAMTLHNSGNPHLTYIPSIFDVAHDFGYKTCLFAGKHKFIIYDWSYDATRGAPDRVGKDNGRDKLDVAVIDDDLTHLLAAFRAEMTSDSPCGLAFFHIADPDLAGHRFGWGGEAWQAAVARADSIVAEMLTILRSHPGLKGETAVVVTADHGGHGVNHADTQLEADFTIPFYVMAPGIPAGADLYRVFPGDRGAAPGTNPDYRVKPQPIRNGDAGNLGLHLLGLPPVPGSLMFSMRK